jgi:predicted RNA binding protein with dsRBD fold (UPF0201 family)
MKFDKLVEGFLGSNKSEELDDSDYLQKIALWEKMYPKVDNSKVKSAVNDMFYVYKHSIHEKDAEAFKALKNKTDIIIDFLKSVY